MPEEMPVTVTENTGEEIKNSEAATTEASETKPEVIQEEQKEAQQPTPKRQYTPEEKQKHAWEKMRKEAEAAKAEAAYWRGRTEGNPSQPISPSQDENKVPSADDFQSWDDYKKAETEYFATQAIRREFKRKEDEDVLKAARDEQGKAIRMHEERIEKARAKYEDFEEIVNRPDIAISQVMANAIVASDISADLLYYLGQHPNEAIRMVSMNPIAAAKEIGKIEAKLSIPTTEQLKRTTEAPKPIPTVDGVSSKSSRDIYDPNLSTEERIAMWRRKK